MQETDRVCQPGQNVNLPTKDGKTGKWAPGVQCMAHHLKAQDSFSPNTE